MNWQKQNCDGIIAEYAETEKSPAIKPERYILGDKGFFQSLKHTYTSHILHHTLQYTRLAVDVARVLCSIHVVRS